MTAESNIQRKLDRIKFDPLDLSFSAKNLYFWGWLWSDGYIQYPNRISLEIISSDFENISHVIPSQFNYYHRHRDNRKPQSSAIACREDYVEFLYQNGYKEKISPSSDILNDPLAYWWFLGVIDGDGSWYYNSKYKTRQFKLASNYDQDWSYFNSMLDEIDCPYKIKRFVQKTGRYSIVRVCNKKGISSLFNYLYPDGFIFGLERKYYKAEILASS